MKPLTRITMWKLIGGCIALIAGMTTGIGRTRIIEAHGYQGCVELANAATRVVLEPNLGGRVLSYQLNGVDALYRNPAYDGAVHEPGKPPPRPTAGRFDIGPEKTLAPRPTLWLGRWRAEITGDFSARMTS